MSLALLISFDDHFSGYYVSRDVIQQAMNSAFSTGSLEEAVEMITDNGTFYEPELNEAGDDIFIDVTSGDPMDFVEDVWSLLFSNTVSDIMLGVED